MSLFRNNRQRAIAYAAFKELERMLKEDGELPPGFAEPLTGETITIKLPPGLSVYREPGKNGDGIIQKKATQDLYGYGVWACFLMKLKAFKQHNVVMQIIREAWAEAMRTPATNVETELDKIDPELAKFVKELKERPGPMRDEQTPRKVERLAKGYAQLTFGTPPAKAA